MTDLSARADRVRQIAESLFGKLLSIDDDVAEAEVPADLSGAFSVSLGASGFSGFIIGQDCRQAPKRVVTMDYRTIVTDQMATMAFYRFRVELQDRHAKMTDIPHSAAITATRPVGQAG
jgi:hypothetical protein